MDNARELLEELVAASADLQSDRFAHALQAAMDAIYAAPAAVAPEAPLAELARLGQEMGDYAAPVEAPQGDDARLAVDHAIASHMAALRAELAAPAAEPVAQQPQPHDAGTGNTETPALQGAPASPAAQQPEAPTLADDDSPANGMATDNNIASHTNLSTDDFARELRLLPIYRMLAREIAVWTERAAARIESDARVISENCAELARLYAGRNELQAELAASRERERRAADVLAKFERSGRVARELGLSHDIERAQVWEGAAMMLRDALAAPDSAAEQGEAK